MLSISAKLTYTISENSLNSLAIFLSRLRHLKWSQVLKESRIKFIVQLSKRSTVQYHKLHATRLTYYKPVEPQNKILVQPQNINVLSKRDSERGEIFSVAQPWISCDRTKLHTKRVFPTLFRRIWKILASYMRRHSVRKPSHSTFENIYIYIYIHLYSSKTIVPWSASYIQ